MKTKRNQGFTLIELLVVITIIAILASIAAPVFNSVQRKAQQTKALSNAKQIGLACKLFALDNDGIFPNDTGANATVVFAADLINGGYIPNEEIFFVTGDHSADDVKLALVKDGTLATTENGWGYNRGFSDTDYPQAALVFTQPASATAFQERGNTNKAGGVWDGKAIVANIDYSATVENIPTGGIIVRGHGDSTDETILGFGSSTALQAR
jgi:prepilin-type N-terminal cleavage/methylation domain-containing protein